MILAVIQYNKNKFWLKSHIGVVRENIMCLLGMSKANVREPKRYLSKVFDFKIGCFVFMHALCGVHKGAHPKYEGFSGCAKCVHGVSN